MKLQKMFVFVSMVMLCSILVGSPVSSEESGFSIFQATLMEPNEKTPDISTEELRKILADKSATVFDSRSLKAYEIDHIPGAVSARGDISIIDRTVQGNKAAPIVVTTQII